MTILIISFLLSILLCDVTKGIIIIVLFLRLAVEEGEEALRREQTRVKELQQQLEQERSLSLRKDREQEERRGVR